MHFVKVLSFKCNRAEHMSGRVHKCYMRWLLLSSDCTVLISWTNTQYFSALAQRTVTGKHTYVTILNTVAYILRYNFKCPTRIVSVVYEAALTFTRNSTESFIPLF
jgi:hypothetical protein